MTLPKSGAALSQGQLKGKTDLSLWEVNKNDELSG